MVRFPVLLSDVVKSAIFLDYLKWLYDTDTIHTSLLLDSSSF